MADKGNHTNETALVFEISRENQRIKASVYERGEEGERTLRPYEDKEVAWEQVEASCREVVSLLSRANKRARLAPEILDGLKKSGQILFDLLIPPKVREKLNSTSARNLVLYVDDRLVHIPWELLFNGQEFLCRRFAMGRIVSTRQVVTSLSSRQLKIPLRVLILADPRGDLRASYREGTEIRNFLDEKRETFHADLKSHPVDISYVKKNLRDYDIVHYAGHADYHPQDPSESGWLLTDGRLKASEISAMVGLQPMPFLVFSNACQSGQTGEWQVQEGYEQQIFGLANAYLFSGVQHYIGTFWEILDEPSLYFAKRFYSFLAQGKKVGEAVRRAREDLIEAYGEETIVWASYMLYGDPTFAFTSAEREVPIRPIAHKAALREDTFVPTFTARVRASPLLYGLLGIFLLSLAFIGYSRFYPKVVQKEKFASAPASLLTPGPLPETNKSVVTSPLSLSMNILGQRKEADGSYTEVLVKEGSILRSRDNFQIHLATDRPSSIYVLLYDSQGRASQLFPNPEIDRPGFIEAGTRVVVPDKDLWFWLDENAGTETIYVLASEKPMSDIRGLLTQMVAAGREEKRRISQEIKKRISFIQRGVGGITKGKPVTYSLSDGRRIEKVTEVVTGAGAVVRAVSFQHR
ncbi:MAG: CHAT domain-containing protein [Deltaproteobacteria bacterium]|nr:CHAT domain-containing protein [Deltaproteobacteria bacterium]